MDGAARVSVRHADVNTRGIIEGTDNPYQRTDLAISMELHAVLVAPPQAEVRNTRSKPNVEPENSV